MKVNLHDNRARKVAMTALAGGCDGRMRGLIQPDQ